MLFALSRFDDDNKGHPGDESKTDLPLDLLKKGIDACSQNLDVYIPLMGTGNSRYNLSNEESFTKLKYYFLSKSNQIESKYRILVYSGIRDEVSIFK